MGLVAVIAVLAAWIFVVTILLLQMKSHYRRLTTRTGHESIDAILEALMAKADASEKAITELKSNVATILENSEHHFQKIGFVRYDPFEREAGAQSFVVALLNKKDTGIVLNFLYTREGVRVYAKHVKQGMAEGHGQTLSDEEADAVKKAVI